MCFHKKGTCYLVIIPILLVIVLTTFVGCGKQATPMQEQAFLLDTYVTVTYYQARDRAAVQEAIALCGDYELVFSRTDSRSELYQLNESDCMAVSDDLLAALTKALEYCEMSDGAFDITMGGVSALYDFTGANPHCPDSAAIAEALSHTGYTHISIEGSTVCLDDPETVIDLGGIAKGYIADRMREALVASGVKHAIISLGGNVLTIGGKPDGSAYQVGIQYPEKNSTALASVVAVKEASVVTSGIYERFFVENGVTYHHILDCCTGYPLQNGLLAVSIIGPCSCDCDALSTLCFALGPERGLELIETTADYEAVFITGDQALHPSSGFDALKP